ncbi:hypothetical protein E2562_038003 [Oryza meyeriana var. granulata]|uniref:Uncharacterized protein n=1 Tax=Oryza meyeriana var. granulata TaxID=110450 RepID=A0A6G1E7D7_9ORYZ|nr:hypothetical protein E2562_038003 [Oryza meyeriana var. granulata]
MSIRGTVQDAHGSKAATCEHGLFSCQSTIGPGTREGRHEVGDGSDARGPRIRETASRRSADEWGPRKLSWRARVHARVGIHGRSAGDWQRGPA